jgi:hypothetical protein
MSFFERLYTYRQKDGKNDRENFLTELLAEMLRNSRPIALRLLNKAGIPPIAASTALIIETQARYQEGIPDLVVRTLDNSILLLVECKLEAAEGDSQLARYEAILKRLLPAHGATLYLTKYYEAPREGHPLTRYMRWYDVYRMASELSGGGLLEDFKAYLACHSLHHPMSFTTTDLLALESIRGTIRTMDEALSGVDLLIREAISDSNQKTATRSGKLHLGWYGMNAWRHGVNLEVGFWSDGGQPSNCFFLVESNYPVLEPTNSQQSSFQHALREAWKLSHDTKLTYIELLRPVTSFMNGKQDGADVQAMRAWFIDRMREFMAVQKLYPLESANHSAIATPSAPTQLE